MQRTEILVHVPAGGNQSTSFQRVETEMCDLGTRDYTSMAMSGHLIVTYTTIGKF